MKPEVSEKDLLDAIEHADIQGDQGWTLADFDVKYLGELPLSKIKNFDDFSSWVEFDLGELKNLPRAEVFERLSSFRGSKWAKLAMSWLESGKVPPIVVIDAPVISETEFYEQIGDGRGRVNLAVAMGLKKLPVYRMKYRGALSKNIVQSNPNARHAGHKPLPPREPPTTELGIEKAQWWLTDAKRSDFRIGDEVSFTQGFRTWHGKISNLGKTHAAIDVVDESGRRVVQRGHLVEYGAIYPHRPRRELTPLRGEGSLIGEDESSARLQRAQAAVRRAKEPRENGRRLSEWERGQRERDAEKKKRTRYGVFVWERENMYRPSSALMVFKRQDAAQKYIDTVAKPDDNWVVRSFETREE